MPVPLAACDCSPSMRRELEGHIHTLTRENEKLKKWNREYSSDLEKARKRIKYLEQYWYSGEEFIEFYTKWDKEVNELRKQVEKRDHLLRHYQDLWKEAVLQCQEQMEEDSAKIKALEEKVLRLNARLETDSRNSSLPVSRTPIGKKKPVPNSRQKTDRPRGGQEGHAKASLAGFEESEVTETEAHTADICPECGSSSLEKGGEDIIKDETDCKVVLIKRRHRFYVYRCLCCGKTFHSPIPLHLKEKNQYGENLKALALSLTDQGYVSIGRTRDMIHGLCNGQIKPSEGYIAKLQKTASAALESFISDLHSHVEKLKLLYWDDTVISVDRMRACFRFYGDEHLAYYTAHKKKDQKGLEEDGILYSLSPNTVVMHDHNTINYNHAFSYRNIECNQHLLRDLERVREESGHGWAEQLKELIQDTIHKRKELIGKGRKGFGTKFEEEFYVKLHECLRIGDEENKASKGHFFSRFEQALLNRLYRYETNYFAWVKDFSLPVTNNLSERSLRGIKSKQKISGQFWSTENAGHYAKIQSYMETCRRNGISPHHAMVRLMNGNPYSVDELLGLSGA